MRFTEIDPTLIAPQVPTMVGSLGAAESWTGSLSGWSSPVAWSIAILAVLVLSWFAWWATRPTDRRRGTAAREDPHPDRDHLTDAVNKGADRT